eukprot:4449472-Ditylum_brightwellii.AAC.1
MLFEGDGEGRICACMALHRLKLCSWRMQKFLSTLSVVIWKVNAGFVGALMAMLSPPQLPAADLLASGAFLLFVVEHLVLICLAEC